MNETTELIMKQLNSKKVHAETHEVGGGDEIDVLKLKNVGSLVTIDHSGKHEIGGSDEIDALKLRNIDTFVTKTGDFTGTWNGAAMTTVEPGLSSAFNALKEDIATDTTDTKNKLNTTALNHKSTRLGNIDRLLDALSRKYVKVAFWGDSITGGGNYLDAYDRWVEQYMVKLQNAFPDVTFVYQNFGIGGRTLEQASDPAYTSPTYFTADWATTASKAWREYVRDYNADLLFIAFGMNVNEIGGAASTSYNLELIKQYLEGVPDVPSIALFTSLVPRKEWAVNWAEREVASYQTSIYAKINDFTLFDVYNRYRILIDGKDEFISTLELYLDNIFDASADGLTFTSKIEARRFEFRQTPTFTANTVLTLNFRGGGQITISSTKINIVGIGDVVIFEAPVIRPTFIKIIVDDKIKIYMDDVLQCDVVYYNKVDYDFVQYSYNQPTYYVATKLYVTMPVDTAIRLGEDDLWGAYIVGDYDTRLPTGGNGVNHPTSLGYNLFYVPLIEEFIDAAKTDLVTLNLMQKTYTITLELASDFAYTNVDTSVNIPFAGGVLRANDGTKYKLRSDIIYSSENVALLNQDEYFIRRSGGFLQIVTKPPLGPLADWKFTVFVPHNLF